MDNVKAYADLKYTTKHDMRNIYGVAWNNAGSTFKVEMVNMKMMMIVG